MKFSRTLVAILALVALSQPPARAAWIGQEDFESYTVASYNGGSTAFVANGGPWESNVGGTGLVAIEEESAGGNKYLAHGWSNGFRGANATVSPIAEGDSGSYYFQVRTEDETPDVSYGLSDVATGQLNSFSDFEAQVALTYSDTDGIRFGARNGGSFEIALATGLSVNTWYDVWIVADNAADTYDVYFGTTGDPNVLGAQVADDFVFRNGSDSNDLVTFMTLSNGHDDNQANLDNISYNATAVPEPSTLALCLIMGGLGLLGRPRA